MYLKRLEMKGFKSFANRTELVFAPGITAIVGPNGSGKSNVTDGIRWVLGEQSAKSLRGAKMEDVIFAGSSSRKPVGYCEVSITFDNADQKLFLDYDEVTVTRRVNRSGESQFFLNKQACRLKDIHELFMDTGIGKEAYSLIGQGRIDEILSAKSEGRRAIFEEAAGIVKYKTRKNEAERKLEQTEENLSRIHDRIHELQTQIEPMKEQAEKAKEWKKKKDELKKVEIALYVDKIERLHQSWVKTSKLVEEKKEKQIALTSAYHTKEAELEQIKLQLQKQEATWEQIQSEMLEISERIKNEEGKQNVYLERMKQQQAQHKRLSKRLRQLDEDQQQLNEKRRVTAQQIEDKQKEYHEIKKHLSELKNPEEDQDMHEQLRTLQEELQRAEHRQMQQSHQQQLIQHQLEQIENEIKACDQRKQITQEEIQRLEADLEQLTTHLIQLEEERRKMEQKIQQLDEQWREADVESQESQHLLQQHIEQIGKIGSQLDVLKEMQKNREGYFRGVKELLRERDRGNPQLSGVYGAVAELIEVPSAYETALETALGNAMQYLIVADEQVGRNGIAFLKRHHLGRATFLPLTVLKARTLSENELAKCKQLSIWCDVAARLAHTKPEFRPALDFLLGAVLVVKTIEDAHQCARLLQQRYRIVTLDGDMVHPGGSMSGGSRKKSSIHLLSRGKQIEQLQKEWETTDAKRKECQAAVQATLATKNCLEKEIERANQQLNELQSKEQAIRQQLREKEFLLQNQQNEFTFFEKNLEQLLAKKERIENERQSVEASFLQHQQQTDLLKEKVDELKFLLEQQTALKEAEQQKLTLYQVKMARLEQELFHHEQSVNQYEQELEKIRDQRAEVLQEMDLLQQELNEQQEKRKEVHQQLQELETQKEQIQLRLIKERKVRENAIQRRDSYEEEIRKHQQSRKTLEAEIHEQEVRVNRLDVELNHVLEKLASEYELSFERAKELYPPKEEVNHLEKKVRSLKRMLSQLGDVNIGAIEEYERLSDRLSFLQSQEADLLEAKRKLYEMIEQIEQEMSKQFLEAFQQIRHEFQLVFSQMFGGGKADLHLTDRDQLLETGIEIVAQPPGKRPQYLSLLSGGERALTAIALLFAVLRIKPVPFCVLDEVDAALDEVNLTRFTRYMKEFANQTQFIIITHRKQTMLGADALYGVTMEESGVSKLVSVQFEALEQQEIATTRE